MLQEILSLNVFVFFMIMARMGTAVTMFPGFNASYVNLRFRLLVALAISFVLTPVLADSLPGLPESPAALGLMIMGEVVIGAFLGTIARVLVAALQSAGSFISLFSAMANALIMDPVAEQQSSVIAGFLSTVGVLVIFTTGLHHLMLRAVVDSYVLFVPGQALAFGDFSELLARHVSDSFALGLKLAAPLAITGLTYYIGLGLLGRLMPALPVFFFGMPVQIMMQISVLMLVLSAIMMVFMDRFQSGMGAFLTP